MLAHPFIDSFTHLFVHEFIAFKFTTEVKNKLDINTFIIEVNSNQVERRQIIIE